MSCCWGEEFWSFWNRSAVTPVTASRFGMPTILSSTIQRNQRSRLMGSRYARSYTVFKPLKDAQQVLVIVRAELRRASPTTERFDIYPFELRYLPADGRLRRRAREWVHSEDPLARYLAVQVFAKHLDPQDTPTLALFSA